ncbi:protein translocase subunit SecF [Candidatus Gracilibacteria bacterium]|nr:protein translocase subunit SecF [Candidatus Gracilibacteria bacterium]
MFRSSLSRIAVIVVAALLIGYFDLPSSLQTVPGTPEVIKQSNIRLGLDLQGGSQLDYKIDLSKVAASDQKDIVNGVIAVINRRVNGIGVSEPNIYTSTLGNEQHIIVELAGIKDLEEAKKIVGKTIQLEFKEKKEQADPEFVNKIKAEAQGFLNEIKARPEQFAALAGERAKSSPGKQTYAPVAWTMSSLVPGSIAGKLKNIKPGTVLPTIVEGSNGYAVIDGQIEEQKGVMVVKFEGTRNTSGLPEDQRELKVSHALISYKGAENAADTVTRSKEEAKKLAEDSLAQIREGKTNLDNIIHNLSDDPSAKNNGGRINDVIKKGASYVEPFINGALKLSKVGEVSDVVETKYGFHIIQALEFDQTGYSQLFFSTMDDPWKSTGLTGEQFERADVTFDNVFRPVVNITFNAEGAKLFEEITGRNINKPLAIFVGGNLISAPNVTSKIPSGTAVITGQRTVEEAQKLAQDLNTGAIPAPIYLNGQFTIGASLGQEALDTSMKAGIIGVALLVLFMILYYRLPGVIATIALSLYTLVMVFLIKSQLPDWLALGIAIVIFVAVVQKILKTKEGGWEKLISFILACFILYFVTFLLKNPITLTLAGVAGVILSIGMAVDANVLIFERMKEELRAGRPLSAAIDVGFDRAWSSIRDSNFSSLITCAILYYFGTSIIQGFAFNLAAGILVSMFTAITITRTLLNAAMNTRLSKHMALWGMPKDAKAPKTLHIVEKSKVWFSISGVLVGISLISAIVFGLKLSIDFKGGTLMDITFDKVVTVDEVKAELKVIGDKLNAGQATSNPLPTVDAGQQLEDASVPLDLADARVVSAGEKQLLINTEHLENEDHDMILKELEGKFGTLTENRFTTIGPVVGETLKRKAVIAVLVAMAMIIMYIAFAFRKVPKRVSPWKFGVCAVIALLHDVLIPIGVFSLLNLEVDALFITAILTVLGFSVHDTIVVFDRIRENLKYQERDESFAQVANKSMSQTIARSVNTSLTVIITLSALLIFGSPSIFNFILALVIGVGVGTYSSIFIATPLLVLWQKKDQK